MTAVDINVQRFEQMLCTWLEVPPIATTNNMPISNALEQTGVHRRSDFILLMKDQ
jgi:hypothetical protein